MPRLLEREIIPGIFWGWVFYHHSHATDSLDPSLPSIHNRHATCHPHQGSNLPIRLGMSTPGESKPEESWDVGFLTKRISVTLYGIHVKSYLIIYQVQIHITLHTNIGYVWLRYLIYIYRSIFHTVPAPNLKSCQKFDHADSPEEGWTNAVSKHRI